MLQDAETNDLDALVDVNSGIRHTAERLRAQADRIRELCDARQADSVGGGRCDVTEIWPSEIIAILDGVPEAPDA